MITRENVIRHLVNECGIQPIYAAGIVDFDAAFSINEIEKGNKLGSYTYYVANQIFDNYAKYYDIPDNWEGYIPGWEAPDEVEYRE